jgi:hypothetical protein
MTEHRVMKRQSKPKVMELVNHMQSYAEINKYSVEELYTACTMIKLTFDEVCRGLDSGNVVPMRSRKMPKRKPK